MSGKGYPAVTTAVETQAKLEHKGAARRHADLHVAAQLGCVLL